MTARRSGPRRERGGIPLASLILLAVIVLLIVGLFATCDALWEDEDEPGDVGAPPALVTSRGDDDDEEEDEGRKQKCTGWVNFCDVEFPDLPQPGGGGEPT